MYLGRGRGGGRAAERGLGAARGSGRASRFADPARSSPKFAGGPFAARRSDPFTEGIVEPPSRQQRGRGRRSLGDFPQEAGSGRGRPGGRAATAVLGTGETDDSGTESDR